MSSTLDNPSRRSSAEVVKPVRENSLAVRGWWTHVDWQFPSVIDTVPVQLMVPGESSFMPLLTSKSPSFRRLRSCNSRAVIAQISLFFSFYRVYHLRGWRLAYTTGKTRAVLFEDSGMFRAYLRPCTLTALAGGGLLARHPVLFTCPFSRALSLSLLGARSGALSSSSSSARRGIARAESRWSCRVGTERNRAESSKAEGLDGGSDARE